MGISSNNDKPKIPDINPDELMETIFKPLDLQNLRLQYARWQRIQEAEGVKDEIGILGYLSIIMKTGLLVTGNRLINEENRLGI